MAPVSHAGSNITYKGRSLPDCAKCYRVCVWGCGTEGCDMAVTQG